MVSPVAASVGGAASRETPAVRPRDARMWDGYVLSGWWRRAFALVFDTLLVAAFTLATMLVVREDLVFASQGGGLLVTASVDDLVWIGVGVVVAGLYYVPQMVVWDGRTLGKQLTAIRVVRVQDTPMNTTTATLRQAIVQYGAAVLVPLLGIFDVLWPLWDRQNRALHDMIARTRVVRDDVPRWQPAGALQHPERVVVPPARPHRAASAGGAKVLLASAIYAAAIAFNAVIDGEHDVGDPAQPVGHVLLADLPAIIVLAALAAVAIGEARARRGTSAPIDPPLLVAVAALVQMSAIIRLAFGDILGPHDDSYAGAYAVGLLALIAAGGWWTLSIWRQHRGHNPERHIHPLVHLAVGVGGTALLIASLT